MSVDGILTAQTNNVAGPFLNILSEFDIIIEIGTYTGAFTLWLDRNRASNTKLVSYDINPSYLKIPNKLDFRVKDCFQEDTKKEIKELIDSGRTLLLCDGGNKHREFKTFASMLKVGDVVMLHDYCDSEEEYKEIAIKIGWPTKAESFYDEIKDCAASNGLQPWHYQDFKEVLWGSFMKV